MRDYRTLCTPDASLARRMRQDGAQRWETGGASEIWVQKRRALRAGEKF